jgi:hypothetical protein
VIPNCAAQLLAAANASFVPLRPRGLRIAAGAAAINATLQAGAQTNNTAVCIASTTACAECN